MFTATAQQPKHGATAMKCIVYTGSLKLRAGVIERVENEEARASVAAGQAVYVSKSAWKKQNQEGAK